MQIVIDIPEKEWTRWIIDGEIDAIVLRNSLINGTPLPKGHGRLIDADDCKKNKKNFCEKSTRTNWYDIIDDLLDDAPTIIKAESEGK